MSFIGDRQKSPEIIIAATDTPSDFRRHKQQPVVKNATFYSYNQPVNLHIYIGKKFTWDKPFYHFISSSDFF